MSKGNTTELDLLKKVFNNTAIPWDAIGNLYVSLHTNDPGEAGNQESNEADYTGYTRKPVSRDSYGWDASGNPTKNVAEITFPQCTGGTNVITHLAIGTLSTGAGQILYKGALSGNISVSNLITPRIVAAALQILED